MNYLLPSLKAACLLLAIFIARAATGQTPTPDLLYYKFNGTGTSVDNLATSPPSGTTTATINGGVSQGSTSGTCGGSALVGSGVTSTTDYVNTGWVTDLRGSWTLSFWTSNIGSSSTLFYIFGDASASSFRCFTNGVAGANNWILRAGGFPDVLVTGAATTAAHVTTFVRDSAAGYIYAYLDGSLVNSIATTAVGATGTGPFKVCGYGSNVGLPANGLMDEFRFYKRALSAQEVATLLYGSPNTGTINHTQCGGTYKSPSGKYTWATSGIYKDTLTNSKNCDSVITVNLNIKLHTASTISPTACDTYTSPSSKYTWTASGTYKDTIPNAAGCDSVITINLTVNNSTISSFSATACDSYTSPSGKYTWTTSGNYLDTMPNTAGCDSVMNITLTVNVSSTTISAATVCDSYTSPSGKYTWTTSGVYADTLTGSLGCDSILSINLTVNYSSSDNITLTACNSYTGPSGKYTWNTSGVYTDTLINGTGCDSVITVNLTVNYTTTDSINPIACNSYTAPSGMVYTTTGLYKDTIPNTMGCDSIVTINLTVNYTTTSTISPTACVSYTSPSGQILTTTGNYTDTIPNTNGCDSIISIALTINAANAGISQNAFTLTATAAGAAYQWLDCGNSYAIVGGETSQSFVVTTNGDYAVEVTENGCTDTSVCISITNVGIGEVAAGNGIAVYPNPSAGKITVYATSELTNATVKIISITGQTVAEKTGLNGTTIQLDYSAEAAGIYFVEIADKGTVTRLKIVKY